MNKELRTDIFYVLKNTDKFNFAAGKTEKIGDATVQQVEVSGEGQHLTWYIDPPSGALLREKSSTMGPGGPADQLIDYVEWHAVKGYGVPRKLTITTNGEPTGSAELVSFEPLPKVEEKDFQKPYLRRGEGIARGGFTSGSTP